MANCLLCNYDSHNFIFYPSKSNCALGFKQIAVCNNCGLGVALPQVDQERLDDFYSAGNFWQNIVPGRGLFYHQQNQAISRFNRVKRHAGSNVSRVLDFGAGNAYLAEICCKHFDDVEYCFLEPDDHIATQVSNRVSHLKVSRITELEGEFDLIFLNHVLEHTADPVDFLGFIISHLKSDGILYVETPRHDFLHKDDVFPHTLFFNQKSYEEISEKIDMQLLESYSFKPLVENSYSLL